MQNKPLHLTSKLSARAYGRYAYRLGKVCISRLAAPYFHFLHWVHLHWQQRHSLPAELCRYSSKTFCHFRQIERRAALVSRTAAFANVRLIGKQEIALLGVLLTLQSAHATVTVGELSRLQSETILLQAKLKKAELQAELFAKTHLKLSSEVVLPPVVQAVYGAGSEHYATLLYDSGVVLDAKPGDLILGGFTVTSISVDKVLISKGKQRVVIGFVAAPLKSTQASSATLSNSQPFELPASLP